MDIYAIRNRNLLWLLKANKDAGKRDKDFAQRAGGIDPSFLSQLKGGKKMGDAVARQIDASFNKPEGWMDSPQWETEPAPTAEPDNLARVVEAMAHSQALLAQALAATIPTAARELLGALDNKLPADLRETGYIRTLRSTILEQLAHSDMVSLHDSSRKAPGSRQRKHP